MRRIALLVAAGVVLLGGGDAVARTAPARSQAWRACGAFECTTVRVPLDYRRPHGRTLDLAVARRRADDPQQRIGSLVVNPGGPGAAAAAHLGNLAALLPRSVLARFDVVAVDPRGVGASEGLRCSVDRDRLIAIDLETLERNPRRAKREYELSVRSCLRGDAFALRFMGTVNHARDLDRVRRALGDDTLTYVGLSYGTLLGAVYAELYPRRVRALVLDGAVLPTGDWRALSRDQAAAVEAALERFFAFCDRRGCALADARGAWKAAMRRLASAPLEAGGERLSPGHLASAAFLELTGGEYGYAELATLLRAVNRGDGALLKQVADLLGDDREVTARLAINCADVSGRPSLAELAAFARGLRRHYPLLGWQATAACLRGWPRPAEPLPRIRAVGAAPIMVVGTTLDPATPYAWARALAHTLASGVLVTFRGNGHTALWRGSSCVNRAVVAYLVDGRIPQPITCAP